MFEQIQTLLATKAKVLSALKTDEILLERIPRTMVKRKAQLAELDAQLTALKDALEKATAKK
jgi:hypothetical protein